MTPREFYDGYTLPAFAAWQNDQMSAHLAMHAVSQIDILAEVLFLQLQKSGEVSSKLRSGVFRDELGKRLPDLAGR